MNHLTKLLYAIELIYTLVRKIKEILKGPDKNVGGSNDEKKNANETI